MRPAKSHPGPCGQRGDREITPGHTHYARTLNRFRAIFYAGSTSHGPITAVTVFPEDVTSTRYQVTAGWEVSELGTAKVHIPAVDGLCTDPE